MTAPDFLKAAGINCFNGVQFAPPLEKLHVLDPSLRDSVVYDRYAHILLFPLIDGKDSIRFSTDQPDRLRHRDMDRDRAGDQLRQQRATLSQGFPVAHRNQYGIRCIAGAGSLLPSRGHVGHMGLHQQPVAAGVHDPQCRERSQRRGTTPVPLNEPVSNRQERERQQALAART